MITKRPTIEDIYNHDYFMASPGVREGLLERSKSGDPEFSTEMTDDGEVVYYNAPHGESVPIGRPVMLAMGGSGAGAGRTNAPMSEVAMGLADTLAAPVKGATQGFLGTPGDIMNMMGFTTMPTTEQVKKWLDDNVGMVGDGTHPMEKMGELAAPGGYLKGAKAVVKAKKATAAGTAATAATSAGETQPASENK